MKREEGEPEAEVLERPCRWTGLSRPGMGSSPLGTGQRQRQEHRRGNAVGWGSVGPKAHASSCRLFLFLSEKEKVGRTWGCKRLRAGTMSLVTTPQGPD